MFESGSLNSSSSPHVNRLKACHRKESIILSGDARTNPWSKQGGRWPKEFSPVSCATLETPTMLNWSVCRKIKEAPTMWLVTSPKWKLNFYHQSSEMHWMRGVGSTMESWLYLKTIIGMTVPGGGSWYWSFGLIFWTNHALFLDGELGCITWCKKDSADCLSFHILSYLRTNWIAVYVTEKSTELLSGVRFSQ